MNDSATGDLSKAPLSAASHAVPAGGGSAGALIRRARLAQGIDITTLSGTLKVPVARLQALETDQFTQLVDPVFTRALASSVCRALKLDPAEVLQRLPAITAFRSVSQNRGINTPFRPRDGALGVSTWSQVSRPAMLLGAALLAGAGILVFLPFFQQEFARLRQPALGSGSVALGAIGTSGSKPLATSPAIAGETIEQVIPAVALSAVSNANGAALTPPSGGLFPAATSAVSVPAVATLVAMGATVNSALPAPDASASSTLALLAKSESWVQVTDAKGVVVLNRTLRAGEAAPVQGVLPLAVVIGRADAVAVTVRGQTFGLERVTKNNVARFEVN